MKRTVRAALGLILALCFTLTGAAPASAATSKIDKILKGMTLPEKVGQMFLADCPADAASAAKTYQLGGYVLFAKDFQNQTPASVKKTIQGYQQASKVPMLISVDEEGGAVTRISQFKAFRAVRFWAPMALYQSGGKKLVLSDAREKAKLLKSMGINVNLAPVVDVPTSSKSFIYARSFGTDPKLTGQYAAALVKEDVKAHLGAVLKHFPGYGDNGDTHTGIIVDSRPLSAFQKRDLVPFKAGISAGAAAVLVSHNIVQCYDKERPASLSPKVHKALRSLGFKGVAMTDDLAMGAITSAYGQAEAAVMAVEAGNDMLISQDFKTGIDAIVKAVKDGRIKESTIDQSVRRILQWKQSLGLI